MIIIFSQSHTWLIIEDSDVECPTRATTHFASNPLAALQFHSISQIYLLYIQYLTQKPLVGSYLFWWQHISSILYWYPKIKWFRAFVNDHGYFWPSKSSNMIEHHGINCAHGVPDDSVGVILVTFQPNPRTFCRDVCISSQIYIKIDWCIRNDKYK